MADRTCPYLRRSFSRTLFRTGLCLVCLAGGCESDIERIDRQTDELLRERTMQLGGDSVTPRRAGVPTDDELRRRSLTNTEPASVNPAASELTFTPADEARNVEARLGGYDTASRQSPMRLDLLGALRQAQQTGREFITAEEEYILSAISLLIERHLWDPRFFADVTTQVSAFNPSSGTATTALEVIGELRATQRLPYGGEVEARYVYALTEQLRDVSTDSPTSAQQLVLRADIPLLRGAGDAARENLIQSERNLVYAARTFEDFRRAYLVQIAQDYFDLVEQAQQIKNQEDILVMLRGLEERTRALVRAGRLAEFQTNIAASDVVANMTRLASAREQYLLAVDRFKVRLGLPIDTNLEILPIDLGLPDPDVTVAQATTLALDYRLDLQTERDQLDDALRGVNVAKNNLLPTLDLFGSADLNTGQRNSSNNPFDSRESDQSAVGGVTFGLPLDREIERLRLRQATINAERAKRNYDEFRDNVIVEVRSRVRELDRTRFDLDLAQQAVYINERRATEQEIKKDEVTPQQVVETARSLLESLNGRDRAATRLRTAVLQYLLSTGQLRVQRDGTLLPPPGMDTTFKPPRPYVPPERGATGVPDAPPADGGNPPPPPPPANPNP